MGWVARGAKALGILAEPGPLDVSRSVGNVAKLPAIGAAEERFSIVGDVALPPMEADQAAHLPGHFARRLLRLTVIRRGRRRSRPPVSQVSSQVWASPAVTRGHPGREGNRVARPFGAPWRLLSPCGLSLPCRRSRVRIPSSAPSKAPRTRGFCLGECLQPIADAQFWKRSGNLSR